MHMFSRRLWRATLPKADSFSAQSSVQERKVADIVLAEHRGQAWLVSGDRYIDDLLANKLPSDISIEIVSCGSHADVIALLPSDDGTKPCWAIHPGIVKRLQRIQGEHTLSF